MHPHGVQMPLSETESLRLLHKEHSEIIEKAMALHNSVEGLLGRHNGLGNRDLNTNVDKAFDSSLDDSSKKSQRRKRPRTDDEEEESPEDDQRRVRVVGLGQEEASFACPFAKCDHRRSKSCAHIDARTRRLLQISYRRQKQCPATIFMHHGEVIKDSRLRRYGIFMSNRYANPQGKLQQRYMPSLHGLQQREIPGTINDIPVQAVPDYGSSIDAISDGFARDHGMEVKAADRMSINLPGGRVVESVGVVVGHFKFLREGQTYTRHFRVLKRCAFDMVLGREFLEQTKTLTDFYHRIVKRFRPCVRNGGRFFLLGESPKDRIRCVVNGSNASAFPDTGSDLMLISGDFARHNKLKVRRGKKYRQQVQLADGSFIRTDGMVLNAELEFDAPPMSSAREFDLNQYLEYDRGLTELLKKGQGANAAKDKSIFICDLHVVDELPCDIILSDDFIFDHQVFSRFKHLFSAEAAFEPSFTSRLSPSIPAPIGKVCLDDYLLFIRSTKKGSRFPWGRRRPPTPAPPPPTPDDQNTNHNHNHYNNSALLLQNRHSWEGLWEAEEARRNRMQLWIASLPEPVRTEEQRAEAQRREDWDRNHPRPPPPMRLVLPPTGAGIGFGMGISGVRGVGEPPGGVSSA